MFAVVMLYPQTSDSHFNFDYYISTHLPRIREIFKDLGLVRAEIQAGIASAMPGSESPYSCICTFTFETLEGYGQGFAQEGAWIMGDIHNYTNVQPLIQISNIMIEK